MNYSNRSAIIFSRKLLKLEKELKEMERQEKQLGNRISRQIDRIEAGRRVNRIHDGIAIHEFAGNFYTCTEEITTRAGHIYKNVNTYKWCTITYTNVQLSENSQTNMRGWDTYEEAIQKILDWISKGIRP